MLTYRFTGETGTILKVVKNPDGASRAMVLTDMSSKELEVRYWCTAFRTIALLAACMFFFVFVPFIAIAAAAAAGGFFFVEIDGFGFMGWLLRCLIGCLVDFFFIVFV